MSYPQRFGATTLSAGGVASGAGNNTLIAATEGTKIRVVAFSLTTLSTTGVLCIFQSGAGGEERWRVRLKAPTDVSTGANLATSLPTYLFTCDENELLNLNLSAAESVDWAISYVKEPVS